MGRYCQKNFERHPSAAGDLISDFYVYSFDPR